MEKLYSFLFVFLFVSLINPNISFDTGANEKLDNLKEEVSQNLTGNLLPFWSSMMIDSTNGGFYGRISVDNVVEADADKGGILNARILWTFSAAYSVTNDPAYLQIADRSWEYIMTHFIDREYGGAYRSLNSKGKPTDDRKQTYTQSFFIYGFTEYYRATGEKESLETAKSIFEALEKFAFDKESNGYFEVFTRDWNRTHDRLIGEKSDKDEKTMNTHLHLLEAYANLYRVWPDKRVEERLRNLIAIFLEKIIDKKSFHLINFMDRNWNSTSSIDSYGHDIEASWLLYEATSLLNDPDLLKSVKKICIRIADAAGEGIQPDGSLVYEKDVITGHVNTNRSWWAQAETVVGYLNAWELTGNERYLDISIKCWEYIKAHHIDYAGGGWFANVSSEGVVGSGDKGGFWICPYHNGRMCLEVMERAEEEN